MKRAAAHLALAFLLLGVGPEVAGGEPRAAFEVYVRGPRGRVLPEARLLQAVGRHGGRPIFEAHAESLAVAGLDGRLQVPAAPEAGDSALLVWTPGTAPVLLPGRAKRVTVRLMAARTTTGTVRLAGGSPAGGRRVLAVPAAGHADVVHRVRTDARGAYRFETLHPGAWDLLLELGGGRLQRIGRVEAGGSLGAVELRASTALRGRLLDADRTRGAPAADVELRFEPVAAEALPADVLSVRTGPDGSFLASGLAPGVHRVVLADAAWAFEQGPLHVQVEERRARQLPTWFALRLPAVEGRVLDLAGKPVTRARVLLISDPTREPAPGARQAPAPAAETASDGRFRLVHVPPAEGCRLLVVAAGYAPWASDPFRVDRGRDTALDPVRLRPGWRVRVAVRSLEGRALAGARVTAVPATRPTVAGDPLWGACARLGTSDASGILVLGDLPADDVLLQVDAPGWLPARAVVAYPRVSDLRDAEVVLERAAGLEGRVLAAEGGPPGPYRLRAVRRDGQGTHEVLSGADGRFRMSDLAGSATDLHVLRVGAPAERTLAVVESVLPGPEAYLEIQLPALRRITGQVAAIDPTAGPVEVVVETRVFDERLERDTWHVAARAAVSPTGSTGAFLVSDLPPGAYALRAVQGARDSGTESIVLGGEDLEGLDLVLPSGARLAGTVLDGEDRPLLGARVFVTRWHGDAASAARGPEDLVRVSDESGGYVFEGLAPGVWRVEARDEGRASDVEILRLLDGEVQVVRDLRLGAGGALAGRVEDGEGRPLEAVAVRLQHMDGDEAMREAVSDASGVFLASSLRPGTWRLQVRAATVAGGPWVEAVAEVEEGRTTTVRFGAAEDGAIGGTVRLRGQPVPGAVVELLHDPAGGEPLRRSRLSTDGEGRFLVEQLPAGAYTVHLESGSWRSQEELDLRPGDRLDLDLEAYEGRLRGRVLTRDGAPVGSARVVARPLATEQAGEEEERFFAEVRSDPNGDFVLHGIPVGVYVLSVSARGLPPGRYEGAQAELPGADFAVDVVLGRGGDVHLRVVDGEERGVTGALVWLLDEGGRALDPSAYVTGAAGRLRIEGVPSGDLRVRVRARGLGAPAPVHVRVDEGRTSDLVVRLAPAGAVRLVVHGQHGDPLGRTRVDVVRLPDGEIVARRRPLSPIRLGDPWGWVPRTGVVTVGELAAGEYEVRVSAGRTYEPQSVRVRVEAGRSADLRVELQPR